MVHDLRWVPIPRAQAQRKICSAILPGTYNQIVTFVLIVTHELITRKTSVAKDIRELFILATASLLKIRQELVTFAP